MSSKRLTRSSANPTLKPLPLKSRGNLNTASCKALARPQHTSDDNGTPETADQSYAEAVTLPTARHLGDQVVRRGRAPVVVVSTALQLGKKRVATGKSIVSAGTWETPGAASTASKEMAGGNATGTEGISAATKRRKNPISATRETQEVIVVANEQNRQTRESIWDVVESSENEELRDPISKRIMQTTQKGYDKAVPKCNGASKGSYNSYRLSGSMASDSSALSASTPKQTASPRGVSSEERRGESSEEQLVEEYEMNSLLTAAVKQPHEAMGQGEDPGHKYGSLDESLSECHETSGPESEDQEATKSREATPGDSDSLSEGDGDDNLIRFISRIQEYSTVLSSISEKMQDLASDFGDLKVLQNPPKALNKVGYVKLLRDITCPIINNHTSQLSVSERFALQQLDEAMVTLSHFYEDTKDFEVFFRRLQKNNLTQRSNIDKCQAGIKKTMKARGYACTSLSTTKVDDETIWREQNKKAARRRIREIEAVVKERERIALGYETPESVDNWNKRGRGDEEDEEVECLQKRIRVEQDEVGGYNDLPSEENLPVVIDEDDVEVVFVEGFGERQKARGNEEMREVGEVEVEVLEDHEWTEDEIDALLYGIERFQGNFRFEKIMNLYGFGNRAPLKDRSVEAIREKAMELKKEIIDSGEAEMLGHFWDDI